MILPVLLLLLSSLVSAPAQRFDSWKVLGPGGGGAQYRPTVSPHDPNRVFVNCDMTGAYITNDGGESWRMFNLRGVVSFFVFDPLQPDVVYAKTIGLWRTTDGGKTWSLIHPAPENVAGISMANDHASERLLTKDGNQETITALAIDPGSSDVLYAGMAVRGSSSLLKISRDKGRTWTEAGALAGVVRKIFLDAKSPAADRTLFIVSDQAVSVRKGGAWTNHPQFSSSQLFADITGGFSPSSSIPVVYGLVPGTPSKPAALLVSKDGGASWRDVTDRIAGQAGGKRAEFDSVAACATHGEVAYLSCRFRASGREEPSGVMKTTDGGETWQLLDRKSEGASNLDPNVPPDPAWFYNLYSGVWDESALTMGVNPNNAEDCWATDYGNTVRTIDGGRTWVTRAFKTLGNGLVTTRGLDVTTCYGLHFDPFDVKRMFISYTDIGAFGSEDGGKTWGIATTGIPRDWRNTTYWIEFDPKVKGRAWAVYSRNHDLPRPKMWRARTKLNYAGGVGISEDGGKTWKVSNSGMPPTAATHILLDPTSPVDARVLYVAGFGTGVHKSSDGGKTWQLKNRGIQGAEPFAWRIVRDRAGVLYLVVARRSEDARFGTEQDGALYRSIDGAETWERFALPQGVNGPNGLAIDPQDPKRLYLAAWSRPDGDRAVDGGIFLSTDAGKTWSNVLSKDQHVYDVTIDPRNPKLLYACGFTSSVWRSEDRGQSWKRIKGFNFKWGHRVIPDPVNSDMIYVTTFGGSLWHGPAKGDPSAREDIVTPVVAY